MFDALNRFISRLDGEDPKQQHGQHGQGAFGFQVLRNTNMSLAIEPFYDFIVGINGRVIDNLEPHLFVQEVRNCAGGMLSLGLWNAKGQRPREIRIHVPADAASLGMTLQRTPLAVATNIWHVLDVRANSPAEQAGLLPYSDYIIGSPEGVLHGESGLVELVDDHIGRPMRLYVYNNEFDVTREVTVRPSRDWGGEGALGCMLGYGALHRLPAALSEPVSAPGETMFDGEGAGDTSAETGADLSEKADGGLGGEGAGFEPASAPSADVIVPAETAGAAPLSTLTPPARSKKKERHHHPNKFMDDYFKEEEQRSRELDHAPSGGGTSLSPPPNVGSGSGPPPPPPPKAKPREEGGGEATERRDGEE